MAGAKLSDADKAALKKLNAGRSRPAARSSRTSCCAAAKDGALVVSDKAELAGLSDGRDRRGRRAGQGRGSSTGKWLIPLRTRRSSRAAVADRTARRARSCSRPPGRAPSAATPTTRAPPSRGSRRSARTRPSCSASRTSRPGAFRTRWRRCRQHVQKFLDDLVPAATAKAQGRGGRHPGADRRSSTAASSSSPGTGTSTPSRCARRSSTSTRRGEAVLRAEPRAQDGVFFAAHELYGSDFKERHDMPVYQPDVRVFEVFDAGRQASRRCSTATTSSATTRTAARGWT